MRVDGTHHLAGTRDQVWAALLDPAVLARTLPGCLALARTGEDAYAVTVTAGVASIKGVYSGTVALRDQQAPESYTLVARGQGGPGTVDATVHVTLAEADGGTEVHYDADAVIGGAVGGVGQRVLAGVARKTAAEFFAAVDADLAGVRPSEGRRWRASLVKPSALETPRASSPARSSGAIGEVFSGTATPPAADSRTLLLAALAGAAVALLGVLAGRRTAG